jgi:NAD(P)-dependent dehydrogenase (short-subunit alcohol dehydrogenase family)
LGRWPKAADDRIVGNCSIERNNPIGYFGEPEDLAHLVAVLAWPRARYITSTVIQVDGGMRNAVDFEMDQRRNARS